MKRIIVSLFGLFVPAVIAACADVPRTTDAAPPEALRQEKLNDLFVRLRSVPSDDEAEPIELAILQVWSSSGQPEVDNLMLSALEMARAGDLDGALSTFDQVVELDPRFVEAYDQRALVHVMRDEYPEAVDDFGHVLSLEPRHFEALAGLGRIFLMFGRDGAALQCFDAALAVNPHLSTVREEEEDIREKLAGVPI